MHFRVGMERPGIAGREPIAEAAAPLLTHKERVAQMFEEHHAVVWRTLRRCGLDPEAAADVGQQAFVVALERVADIWPGSERAFLIGTALRVMHGTRRKHTRVKLDDRIERVAADRGSAEDEAARLELLDRVLEKLEKGLIEVFVLHDVEGFSSPEIAQALAIPIGTVASRLRRARERFRQVAHQIELEVQRRRGEL